jgi:hypothetical protein
MGDGRFRYLVTDSVMERVLKFVGLDLVKKVIGGSKGTLASWRIEDVLTTVFATGTGGAKVGIEVLSRKDGTWRFLTFDRNVDHTGLGRWHSPDLNVPTKETDGNSRRLDTFLSRIDRSELDKRMGSLVEYSHEFDRTSGLPFGWARRF